MVSSAEEIISKIKETGSFLKYECWTLPELRKKDRELKRLKTDLFKLIIKLNNSVYQIILIERYINNRKNKEIAVKLNFSTAYIKQLHKKALEELKRKFPNDCKSISYGNVKICAVKKSPKSEIYAISNLFF